MDWQLIGFVILANVITILLIALGIYLWPLLRAIFSIPMALVDAIINFKWRVAIPPHIDYSQWLTSQEDEDDGRGSHSTDRESA